MHMESNRREERGEKRVGLEDEEERRMGLRDAASSTVCPSLPLRKYRAMSWKRNLRERVEVTSYSETISEEVWI